MLTLHLRKLSELEPVTASMGTFRSFIEKWRRYNNDRDFTGDYAPVPPG